MTEKEKDDLTLAFRKAPTSALIFGLARSAEEVSIEGVPDAFDGRIALLMQEIDRRIPPPTCEGFVDGMAMWRYR